MRAEPIDAEYYNRRLEALRKLPASISAFTIDEIRGLSEHLIAEAAPFLQLSQVEKALASIEDLDLRSLLDVASILDGLHLSDLRITDERTIIVAEQVGRLRELTSQLQNEQQVLHRTEAWLRLELLLDRILMSLLLCAAASDKDLSEIVRMAHSKLQHLPEVTLVTLWARVQREFEPDRLGAQMPQDAPEVSGDFLRLGTGKEIAEKISRYVFQIKPHLVVRQFRRGVFSYPLDSIGPARVLAININGSIFGRDLLVADTARAIGRFAALWRCVLGRSLHDLADLIGLSHDSRLLVGTEAQDAIKIFRELPAPERSQVAVYELQHLILLVQRHYAFGSPLHQALWQYKLGLEVTLPGSAKLLRDARELTLQKELCKFLIERGIYSEGTKFGPFETDLLATVQAQAYLIEVKLFPAGRDPTASTIKASLSQLQDYMSKRVARPRGVLVLYNFSSTLLVEPRAWLKGRYWITAINLGGATGSRRRRSLVMEEGVGTDLLAMHVIEQVNASGAKRT